MIYRQSFTHENAMTADPIPCEGLVIVPRPPTINSMLVKPAPPNNNPGRLPTSSMENMETTTPTSKMILSVSARMQQFSSQYSQSSDERILQSRNGEEVRAVSKYDRHSRPLLPCEWTEGDEQPAEVWSSEQGAIRESRSCLHHCLAIGNLLRDNGEFALDIVVGAASVDAQHDRFCACLLAVGQTPSR